jgi:hypothetical protein
MTTPRRHLRLALALVLVLTGGLVTAPARAQAPAPSQAPARAQAPAPTKPPAPAKASAPAVAPAPAVAAAEIEGQLEFLRTAKVVSSRPIGKGITGAKRVTLSDGARTHDAAFQAVAKESVGQATPRTLREPGQLRFVDHYRYNIAAWRLARLVGLEHMMPATVERDIGATGALSWWVDDVLMDEEERQKTKASPPAGGSVELGRQFGRMSVFAELVSDSDRNKGNVVFTRDWRLVMLDFTRAFRLQKQLKAPSSLNACDRRLLTRLRALTAPALKDAVERHLTDSEIESVMARRDLLVSHFDRLIAQRGEAVILY